MAQLFGSPVNAALINVFFLTDRNKKDTRRRPTDVEAARRSSPSASSAAGIMGSGIAAATLKRELPVALTDAVAPKRWPRACKQVLEEVAYNRQTKGPDAAARR